MQYYEHIQEIADTKGQNAKIEKLREAIKNIEFKTFIQHMFDPNFNMWVRSIRTDIAGTRLSGVQAGAGVSGNQIIHLINYLKTLSSRTSDAVSQVEHVFRSAPVEEVPYLYMFLKRDINAGFSCGLIKRVDKDLIPEYRLGLAAPYNEKKLKFPVYVENKLDGLRCISTVTRDGQVTSVSRRGKVLELDPKFEDELRELADHSDWVFDGELIGVSFKATMEQAHRKNDRDLSKMKFYIFDAMPLNDWIKKDDTETYTSRKEVLCSLFKFGNHTFERLEYVQPKIANDIDTVTKIYNQALDEGFEGIVMKRDEPYEWKRSHNWMKLKPVETWDGQITGWYEGNDRFTGMLGGFNVSIDGVITDVGGGYTDKQRKEFWESKSSYIGKWVEIEGQELTPDGKVRFPEFIKFRPDKD
jgi:DNA ligase 1